ncbi:heterokaryon incompatibility protein-domain-containing protein [Podospora aff. communis PSN243]|uniref:Heterokaryon incompatibility protein-domain-containing protein n=1 Tax=Podospora aff. communis PSN243 TaxID=3040156 RepID=A0AAV9GCR3_9PEZI|nr:heterokaryon incompatibility protein-domain-containing protein [Podospora aff. communis PSN243]
MAAPTISAPDQVPDYTYKPLQGSEIRLITILPGSFHDDILVDLIHEPLSSLKAAETLPLTLDEVQRGLPEHWFAYEIPGGRFIFRDDRLKYMERAPGAVSWKHPIDGLERSRYPQPAQSQDASGPRYEALSYEWGPPQNTETMYINGETKTKLRIRQNLASAIRHLRYPDRPRTLWADAVCINQADMDERAAQILRMADIYRLAQLVIAWVGPLADNSGLALETIKHLGQQMITTLSGWRFPGPDAPEPRFNYDTALPYSDSTWSALTLFLDRGWFQRLWVVQEVQLARHATVVCGNDTIDWVTFWQAAPFLVFHCSRHVVPNAPTKEAIARPLVLGLSYSTRAVSATLNALARHRQCTDPRDAIFGLLGLLPERFRLAIRPRYDTPIAQVYKEAMLAHINHVQRLELLVYCSLNLSKPRDKPSWVPDFLDLARSRSNVREQFASGYSRSWTTHALDAQSGSPLLTVAGVQAATITRIHGPFPGIDDIPGMLATARKLQPTESAASKLYPTGETFGAAHAMTMGGNTLMERYPGHDVDDLETWLQVWNALFLAEDVKDTGSGAEAAEALSQNNVRNALEFLDNQTYFETDRGYIGLSDGLNCQLEPGDIICVLLGLDAPVILRPHPTNPKLFTFVSAAFVYGLHDGIALLGPMPKPWVVQITIRADGYIYKYCNTETGEVSDNDPRLGELDAKWKRVSAEPRTNDDPATFQRFVNQETGAIITYDPRMDRDALIERGVDLRMFILI